MLKERKVGKMLAGVVKASYNGQEGWYIQRSTHVMVEGQNLKEWLLASGTPEAPEWTPPSQGYGQAPRSAAWFASEDAAYAALLELRS